METKSLHEDTLRIKPIPHPLRYFLIDWGKFKLWEIILGLAKLGVKISESKISRVLRGIDAAWPELEIGLKRIFVAEVRGCSLDEAKDFLSKYLDDFIDWFVSDDEEPEPEP
jgi:hypothetical protein